MMKYLHLFNYVKTKLFKPKESQILLGRWKLYDDEKLKNLSMSNSNKDNCSYNHNVRNVTIEELVVMTHNNSKPIK